MEPIKSTISFEDFNKLDIRVGTILEALEVPESRKLVQLTVDLGFEKRQVLAGIRKLYPATELTGRQVMILANLEPKTLAGLPSQGMVLAVTGGDGFPILLLPERPVPNGSEVH